MGAIKDQGDQRRSNYQFKSETVNHHPWKQRRNQEDINPHGETSSRL